MSTQHKKLGFSAALVLTVMAGFSLSAEEKKVPESFYLSSGDLKIRFDARKFYNMNRIEYKGVLVCVDNPGSHYGTVFGFPGIGFIGSGHVENEPEQLVSLEAYTDGKKVALENLRNNDEIKAADFKLVRNSKIKGASVSNTIAIKNNIIDEQVTLASQEDVKLSLIYNFMHPWTTEMGEFTGETPDGTKDSGTFDGAGKFKFNKEMKWVAVYSARLKLCAVSWLVENNCPNKSIVLLWDKPPVYRKFYLRSYKGEILKKNSPIKIRLKTSFLPCQPDNWREEAEKIAYDILAKGH